MATFILCKYPSNNIKDVEAEGKFFAWHQDLMYWGIKPLEEVTVWVAIDDTDEENGGMKFLPGALCSQKCIKNADKNILFWNLSSVS